MEKLRSHCNSEANADHLLYLHPFGVSVAALAPDHQYLQYSYIFKHMYSLQRYDIRNCTGES